jgi:hypothetical protein
MMLQLLLFHPLALVQLSEPDLLLVGVQNGVWKNKKNGGSML